MRERLAVGMILGSVRPEVGELAHTEVADDGRDDGSGEKLEGGDASFEMLGENRLTRGVGGVGDDGESAADDRSGNNRMLGGETDIGDLGG